ncbi:MAG: hypothetical protein AAF609_08500 [Cyanobacteria bacterium P01_C01_bin.120]
MDLSSNFQKSGAYQAYQFQQSYRQLQAVVLVAIVACSIVSSALCSPELTYIMILGTYALVGYGESLTEKLEMTRRRVEDYQAVGDEAFTQLAYTDMMAAEELVVIDEEVSLSDGMAYLREAATNWRSHLGLLAPTDTGKSSTMALLLALMSNRQRIMVVAVESKGAEYPGVPAANILRIGFRPSRDEVEKLIKLLDMICYIAQARADTLEAIDCQIVLILEEWLSVYNTISKVPGVKDLAPVLESYVYTLVGVGRGCGVQVILTAQSSVAADLGISGSVRSNLRYMALGSNYGGFEGIENAFANYRIVSPSRREKCQQQLAAAIKQLKTNRHPLILTNLIGRLEIFTAPYLRDSEMAQISINTRQIDDRLEAIIAGKPPPTYDAPPEEPEPAADSIYEELKITKDESPDEPAALPSDGLSITDAEGLIIGFLEGKPQKNFTPAEIRRNVRILKDQTETKTIELICEGLVGEQRLIRVRRDNGKTRYMAP